MIGRRNEIEPITSDRIHFDIFECPCADDCQICTNDRRNSHWTSYINHHGVVLELRYMGLSQDMRAAWRKL